MCCRSWRASNEQLQWQVADLQRKLKDSEQRATLWARRAGAAEARVPVQATSAKKPLSQGRFPTSPAPVGSASFASASAGMQGRAVESSQGMRNGAKIVDSQESTCQQEGACDHEEEGSASALLQEALSVAADLSSNTQDVHSMQSAAQYVCASQPLTAAAVNDGPVFGASKFMHQIAEGDTSQSHNPSNDHAALRQRIAEYRKQSGLPLLPRVVSSTVQW